jgi:hypothetical protein
MSNDTNIRKRKLLLLCAGWSQLRHEDGALTGIPPAGGEAYHNRTADGSRWVCPDPFGDDRILRYLEGRLDDEDWLEYMLRLADVLGVLAAMGKWSLCRRFMEASVAHRAEAMGLALGMWAVERQP